MTGAKWNREEEIEFFDLTHDEVIDDSRSQQCVHNFTTLWVYFDKKVLFLIWFIKSKSTYITAYENDFCKIWNGYWIWLTFLEEDVCQLSIIHYMFVNFEVLWHKNLNYLGHDNFRLQTCILLLPTINCKLN